nr:S41 family peptidase [Pedobacter panaciterrae]
MNAIVKTKLQIVIFSVILFLSFSSKGQQVTSMFDQMYKPEELKEDIRYLKQQLEDQHPALYWYIKKYKLNYKFDSLSKSIVVPISIGQFRYKLACVLASIGDGHMALLFDQNKLKTADISKFDGSKAFPLMQFEYEIFDKKLYIAKSQDTLIKRGMEVLTIDNQPVSEILPILAKGMPADGHNTNFKYFLLKMAMLPDAYSALYGYKDTLSLQLKQGKVLSITLITSSSNPSKYIDTNKRKIMERAIPEKGQNAPALLRIKTFNKINDTLLSDFFAQLKRDTIQSLELDLRGNIGGDHSSMIKLFSFLINKPAFFAKIYKRNILTKADEDLHLGIEVPIKPAENHFDGKLYIYTNEGTFSAASLLAASLQAIKRGTIIGQETGGGRNGCIGGSYVQSTLPHTGLLLKFGQLQIKIPVQSKLSGRGVMPDVKTVYTVKDFLKREDLEHKWLVEQIWPEAFKRLWPGGK